MNVANLELCKELYELSGWEADTHHFKESKPHKNGVFIETISKATAIPAYDLGYLLRKLPRCELVKKDEYDYYAKRIPLFDKFRTIKIKPGIGISPEDAACKLAIELIKQKVITP